ERNLDKYLSVSKLKEKVGIFYDPNRIDISLLDLFDKHCEFKRPNIAETTYELQYRKRILNLLKKCPNDLNQQDKLVQELYKVAPPSMFSKMISRLHNLIKWAKKRGIIPQDAKNDFKSLAEDYTKIKPRKKVPQLLKDIPGYYQDPDYKAFSREEAEIIIQAFKDLAEADFDEAGNRVRSNWKVRRIAMYRYICLLFWTGCRTGEASALRWKDIAPDCSYIIFSQTYNHRLKILKPLKTEKVGEEDTQSRKFPCGKKLRNLLQEMKQELGSELNQDDFLFQTSRGTVLTNHNIEFSWLGNHKGKGEMVSKGVVLKLAEEGKITQYLCNYTTRHTWITQQLIKGVPIVNIAKLAGNSPETILKHYAGYQPLIELADEI
ncbi:MAG: tyrosine-type recombinase/integrase, partial [Halothece sp.]